MTREDFNKIKKEFLITQLNGKKYNIEKGRLLPKDYNEKNFCYKDEIKILKFDSVDENKEIDITSLEYDSDDAIKIAICRAYEDSQPRLIVNHNKIVNNLYDWNDKNGSPLGYLKKQIRKFYEQDKKFDEWHKTTCTHFLDKYNKLLSDKQLESQDIGKAQKIVNMSLKYLFCMTGDKQEDFFRDCHIALDHYTLENWFCRVVKGKGWPSKEQIGAWSKIKDYGEEKLIGSYMWIQDTIRNEYNKNKIYNIDNKEMTPLQAEFIIWEEEKLREVLMAVASLSLEYEVNTRKNDDLKNIITNVSKNIDILKKRYEIDVN